jgi:hypothetical protein
MFFWFFTAVFVVPINCTATVRVAVVAVTELLDDCAEEVELEDEVFDVEEDDALETEEDELETGEDEELTEDVEELEEDETVHAGGWIKFHTDLSDQLILPALKVATSLPHAGTKACVALVMVPRTMLFHSLMKTIVLVPFCTVCAVSPFPTFV